MLAAYRYIKGYDIEKGVDLFCFDPEGRSRTNGLKGQVDFR